MSGSSRRVVLLIGALAVVFVMAWRSTGISQSSATSDSNLPEGISQAAEGVSSDDAPSAAATEEVVFSEAPEGDILLPSEKRDLAVRARSAIRVDDPAGVDVVKALDFSLAACAESLRFRDVAPGSQATHPYWSSESSKLAIAAFSRACDQIGGADAEVDPGFGEFMARHDLAQRQLDTLLRSRQDPAVDPRSRADELRKLLLAANDLNVLQRVLQGYSLGPQMICVSEPICSFDDFKELPGMGSQRDYRSESFLGAVGLSVWCMENPQTCGPGSTLAFLLCRDHGTCRPGYSVRDHLYDQHPARHVHAAQVAAQRIVTARREWRSGAGRGAQSG